MIIGQLCNKDTLADYNIMYIVIVVGNDSIDVATVNDKHLRRNFTLFTLSTKL